MEPSCGATAGAWAASTPRAAPAACPPPAAAAHLYGDSSASDCRLGSCSSRRRTTLSTTSASAGLQYEAAPSPPRPPPPPSSPLLLLLRASRRCWPDPPVEVRCSLPSTLMNSTGQEGLLQGTPCRGGHTQAQASQGARVARAPTTAAPRGRVRTARRAGALAHQTEAKSGTARRPAGPRQAPLGHPPPAGAGPAASRPTSRARRKTAEKGSRQSQGACGTAARDAGERVGGLGRGMPRSAGLCCEAVPRPVDTPRPGPRHRSRSRCTRESATLLVPHLHLQQLAAHFRFQQPRKERHIQAQPASRGTGGGED